ncbi:UDP-N-acetylmuramate--L-alanine ligase [Mesonia ostreae]|uniref:UDP-N-acetylmuramate--L-alanine ligase n=1 Tax=Mesonia ostreae TaxID=861110 RepID=A0ABU2KF76_9FLAO|nr:UDP-N-acetylmuramate--L-alanine ligase [Mesonia ostreae]MDT0293356.1 UDP-N-acetylmuramate--L-alanine ligase [Mesonia ostreae]
MKSLSNISTIYFLGIGGIGMSAIARYFHANGKQVSGYDKTPTQLTKELQAEGMEISFEEEIPQILTNLEDKDKTLIIYTPAVSKENLVYQYIVKHQFSMLKRAEILGLITKDIPTLAVAGTHGKTTTTAILAHILKQCGVKLTAFLGGISENYQTNFINDGNEAAVVEADEFDRSFLQLSPNIAAITSMDADHLDIYGNKEELENSFRAFIAKVPNQEDFFYAEALSLQGNSLGFEEDSDYQIQHISIDNGVYIFDFKTPTETIEGIEFSLPGKHNLMNAAMALAMAIKFGVNSAKASKTLSSFKGVRRRFTYHLRNEDRVLIEDYAHHPSEIDAVYQAVREMHPNKKVLAVFQPHLYSRTQDFANEFGVSLSVFDAVALLDIYPAREQPIIGVDSKMLLEKIENDQKSLITKDSIFKKIQEVSAEVILLLGAGNIGDEANKIKIALNHES